MQGSSIGLEFVETACAWPNALRNAMKYGGPVMVEEKVVGREITVGILGGESLPIVEIIPKQGDYDYANKYTAGATDYVCPAQFNESLTRRIKTAAESSFMALGGGDCARVDFIVRDDGEPVLLEVNTLPGMTSTSLLPRAAKEAGLNFFELCQRLVELSLKPVNQLTQTESI
jgi:D-alanine-D-alanine ligase